MQTLPPLPETENWKPIDSAPKDGRRVWLLFKGHMAIARWKEHRFADHLAKGGYWDFETDAMNRWAHQNFPRDRREVEWQPCDPPPKRNTRRTSRDAPIRRRKPNA